MRRFGTYAGGCSLLCAVLYILGLGVLATPFVPWAQVFHALPVICMVFIIIAFVATSLSKNEDDQ